MATASTNDAPNLLDEDLVSPADGVEELTGEQPAPTTCWRWISKGLRGHKLSSVKVLGRTFTTRQEIRRWLTKVEASRIEAQAATRDDGTGERRNTSNAILKPQGSPDARTSHCLLPAGFVRGQTQKGRPPLLATALW